MKTWIRKAGRSGEWIAKKKRKRSLRRAGTLIICSRNQRIASHKKKREEKLKEVENSFELRNQSQRGEVRADVKNLSQSFGQSRVARVLPELPELPEVAVLAVLVLLAVLCAAGNQLATHFPSQCSCPPATEGGFTPRISSNWQRGCFTSTETVCTRVAWKEGRGSFFDPRAPDTARDNLPHNTTQHNTTQLHSTTHNDTNTAKQSTTQLQTLQRQPSTKHNSVSQSNAPSRNVKWQEMRSATRTFSHKL